MLKKTGEILLVWLIIFFSMTLRTYKADYFPLRNNDDGLTHVWTGTSSFKNFLKPASLSLFVKNNKAVFWRSQYNYFDTIRRFDFRLVHPYFDNPPLAMLLIGLPSYIFGFRDFIQIPQLLVRIPALIASIFSLYFTYILAKKLFNKKLAFISLLVYGLTPIYVFSHRFAVLENFLTPLFLLSLIILKNYLKNSSRLKLFLLLLISFTSGWIKIVGFGLGFIVAFWFLKNEKIKELLLTIFTTLLSFSLYLLYGFLINWPQFKFTFLAQTGRGIYLTSFVHILIRPEFYEPFTDGWYILGFVMVLFITIKGLKNINMEFFSLNFLFWLTLIILTTGTENNFPWYRFPLFPFLSIASAYYLKELLKKPNILLVFPLLLFSFTSIDLLQISFNSLFLRGFYLFLILPFLLNYLFPFFKQLKFLCQKLVFLLLTLTFILNILVSLKFLSKQCKQSNCLIPTKIVVDFKE